MREKSTELPLSDTLDQSSKRPWPKRGERGPRRNDGNYNYFQVERGGRGEARGEEIGIFRNIISSGNNFHFDPSSTLERVGVAEEEEVEG